jgi:hypothetical protein
MDNSIPVLIFNLKGDLIFEAKSYNQTSHYLGISSSSVRLYVDNAKSYYSNLLNEEVILRSPQFNGIAIDRKIEAKLQNLTDLILPNIQLNKLSILYIYCYNEDKIIFTTFFTLTQAYQFLFPKQYNKYIKTGKFPTGALSLIRNRINKDDPVIGENKLKYFFAKNPIRNDIEFRDSAII